MNSNSHELPFVDEVINAIQSVVDCGPTILHEPSFSNKELIYLKECIDSTFVSSVGKYVDQFEAELSTFTGAKYVVAVVNGTAALHIALRLAGVSQGHEVLVPALTFIATANAVSYCGATPHFIDSEERTLGVDPLALREYLEDISSIVSGECVNRRTGKVIRAIVPVHVFGHPVDIEGIIAVAHDYYLDVIEDAAGALGSRVGGQHTGTFGSTGILSFNGNKIITTGGGGAILTNDKKLAEHAKHLTTTAKAPHKWNYVHDTIGFNYRLPNINAALGCAQLEQLPILIKAKRNLYKRYKAAFNKIPQLHVMNEPKGCESNFWLQTLYLNESISSRRDEILEATHKANLMTRPAWTLLNKLPPYRKSPMMDLTVAESLERSLINLPSSSSLV